MTIGVHIAGENIEQNLLLVALKKIATYNASIKIILFTEKTLIYLPENFVKVDISPKPKNKLLLYYWYKYKLPKLLITHNANTFISNVGLPLSNTTLKHFLFIDNTFFLTESNLFFKKQFARVITSVENIFVTNDFIADVFLNKFKNAEPKIKSLYFNTNTSTIPFTFKEMEATKNVFAEGCDYFLFPVNSVSEHSLIIILKAFSQLKKWQKTSMKMLFLFEKEADEKLLPDFKNYKYKNDVKLIKQTTDNYLAITSAAYALIFLGDYKSFSNVQDAFYYNIPVIAANTKANELLFANAATYTATTVADIALQMQLIYKNEGYKKNIIELAASSLERYNTDTASKNLYDIVSN